MPSRTKVVPNKKGERGEPISSEDGRRKRYSLNMNSVKSSRGENDDIHAAKYKAAVGESTSTNKSQGTFNNSANQRRIYFNRGDTNLSSIYLDDINVVDIDNEETFNRVPRLEHKLDLVV